MSTQNFMTIDISAKTLFRLLFFVLTIWFLWFIRDLLLILLVAVLIASALEPLATRLQRFRIPRAISVLTAYAFFVSLIVITITILVPPLIAEIQALTENLPAIYEQLMSMLGRAGVAFGATDFVPSLQKGLLDVGQFLGQTSNGIIVTTKTVFGSIFSILLTFVISFYLVISRDSLYAFVCSVVPLEHRPYTVRIIKKAQQKIGHWLLAQMVLGLIMGIMVFISLWALGVPYALAIALLTFFAEFVPVIGPTISAIPAVLLGFTNSWLVGLIVIVMFLIIQQIESNVLVPNIMRRAVGLNPLTTILAVLVGAKLAGIVGVVLAVPIATIISLFITDLLPSEKEEELSA
ncbi:MAG: AI-2E family transporter [bacterium]|nr:AI-2E family transporter [bacterium]